MNRMVIYYGAILVMGCMAAGCSTAWGRHQLTPLAELSRSKGPCPTEVDVVRIGQTPKRPIIRIALVAADGNGYATYETLEATLKQEATKVCADVVVVTGHQVTSDETVGTYGGGLFLSNTIKRPHLFGIAGRYAKVKLGMNCERTDGTINYVETGSCAEEIGLTEGAKILAVNGIFIGSDEFAIEREVLSREPGDTVRVEYLTKDGMKVTKEVKLRE